MVLPTRPPAPPPLTHKDQPTAPPPCHTDPPAPPLTVHTDSSSSSDTDQDPLEFSVGVGSSRVVHKTDDDHVLEAEGRRDHGSPGSSGLLPTTDTDPEDEEQWTKTTRKIRHKKGMFDIIRGALGSKGGADSKDEPEDPRKKPSSTERDTKVEGLTNLPVDIGSDVSDELETPTSAPSFFRRLGKLVGWTGTQTSGTGSEENREPGTLKTTAKRKAETGTQAEEPSGAVADLRVGDFRVGPSLVVRPGAAGPVYSATRRDGSRVLAQRISLKKDPTQTPGNLEKLKALQHKNVVRVLDVVCDAKGTTWVIMEDCHVTIERHFWFGSSDPVPDEKKLQMMLDIARGVQYLHWNGVVHGDIKPSNALMTADHLTIKISDFDLSNFLQDDTIANSEILAFRAPEFFQDTPRGKATFRGDIFALGLTFLSIIQGRLAVPPMCETVKYVSEMKMPIGQLLEERARLGSGPLEVVEIDRSKDDFKTDVRRLVRRMTHVDPIQRIGADHVVDDLETLHDKWVAEKIQYGQKSGADSATRPEVHRGANPEELLLPKEDEQEKEIQELEERLELQRTQMVKIRLERVKGKPTDDTQREEELERMEKEELEKTKRMEEQLQQMMETKMKKMLEMEMKRKAEAEWMEKQRMQEMMRDLQKAMNTKMKRKDVMHRMRDVEKTERTEKMQSMKQQMHDLLAKRHKEIQETDEIEPDELDREQMREKLPKEEEEAVDETEVLRHLLQRNLGHAQGNLGEEGPIVPYQLDPVTHPEVEESGNENATGNEELEKELNEVKDLMGRNLTALRERGREKDLALPNQPEVGPGVFRKDLLVAPMTQEGQQTDSRPMTQTQRDRDKASLDQGKEVTADAMEQGYGMHGMVDDAPPPTYLHPPGPPAASDQLGDIGVQFGWGWQNERGLTISATPMYVPMPFTDATEASPKVPGQDQEQTDVRTAPARRGWEPQGEDPADPEGEESELQSGILRRSFLQEGAVDSALSQDAEGGRDVALRAEGGADIAVPMEAEGGRDLAVPEETERGVDPVLPRPTETEGGRDEALPMTERTGEGKNPAEVPAEDLARLLQLQADMLREVEGQEMKLDRLVAHALMEIGDEAQHPTHQKKSWLRSMFQKTKDPEGYVSHTGNLASETFAETPEPSGENQEEDNQAAKGYISDTDEDDDHDVEEAPETNISWFQRMKDGILGRKPDPDPKAKFRKRLRIRDLIRPTWRSRAKRLNRKTPTQELPVQLQLAPDTDSESPVEDDRETVSDSGSDGKKTDTAAHVESREEDGTGKALVDLPQDDGEPEDFSSDGEEGETGITHGSLGKARSYQSKPSLYQRFMGLWQSPAENDPVTQGQTITDPHGEDQDDLSLDDPSLSDVTASDPNPHGPAPAEQEVATTGAECQTLLLRGAAPAQVQPTLFCLQFPWWVERRGGIMGGAAQWVGSRPGAGYAHG